MQGSARLGLILLTAGLCSCGPATLRSAPPGGDAGAASARVALDKVEYAGWKQCFRLTNATLEVVVVPTVGRIMHLAPPGQPSLLNQGADWLGRKPGRGTRWANVGGDWFWPVAQSHWDELEAVEWPPPRVLGESPWQSEAWRNADGSQTCLLQRHYKAPLNLTVSRLITLDALEPRVRILQRARSTGTRAVPVTLWNISQMRGPSRVFLGADPTQTSGILTLLFSDPPSTHLSRYGDVLVFRPQLGGEYKFGTGAAQAWVAAQVGEHVLIEESRHRLTGPLPDGGCSVEVYANSTAGYAEIETLTPELMLEPGMEMDNTLLLECRPLSSRLPDEIAADRVLGMLHGNPTGR